jgi:hypothetical protein
MAGDIATQSEAQGFSVQYHPITGTGKAVNQMNVQARLENVFGGGDPD